MKLFKTNKYLRSKNQLLTEINRDLEYKITQLEVTIEHLKEKNNSDVSYIFKLKDEIEDLKLELLNYREVHNIT